MNVIATDENRGKKIKELRKSLETIRLQFLEGKIEPHIFYSKEKQLMDALENVFISRNIEEILF